MTALSLSLLLLGACGGAAGNEGGDVGAAGANQAAPVAAEGEAGNQAMASGGPRAPPSGASAPAKAPQPSGTVGLSVTPVRTTGGAAMTLILSNGAREQVSYNLCTSVVQTSGGRPVPTSRVCTMDLRTLKRGRSADYRYELPVNVPDGSYRFLTQVEWMQSGRRSGVASNSFEVR